MQRIQHEVGKVTVVVVTLLMIGIAAAIFTPKYAVDSDRLTAGNISFILLVFFCILPVLNALFDWLSVGVTRLFLRRYAQRGRDSAWLILADMVLAVVLTVGLYAAVLALFWWMQRLGWSIDAAALIKRFRENPFDPQVSWLAAMAVTNMLPTLFHLALCVLGWLTRGITLARRDMDKHVTSLALAMGAAPAAASPLLAANGQPLVPAAQPRVPLAKPALDAVFDFFHVDHWMALALVFAVIIALWEPYVWLLAQCLAVFA